MLPLSPMFASMKVFATLMMVAFGLYMPHTMQGIHHKG
jgi:hypothetical protein